jgi:hypothetical protein
MMQHLLLKLSDHLPARHIKGENGEPYLERYFVARAFGCELFLHRFLASDPDRGFHNHPWRWAVSLVLSGRYVEFIWSPDGGYRQRWREPGRMAAFGARHLHRVVLPASEKECWTLFLTGPRLIGANWGFITLIDVAGGAAAWIFRPYLKSPSPDWHRTAPRGREIRQQSHQERPWA